ncbi:MAG TPA: head-tail adaptor protein [Sphingomonadaceae bacterium]|nr:head-tail adaptor protein [Sphingomonadaceae bacterium]
MSGALAGLLTERVTIERRGGARDALGGAVGDWNAIGVRWARLEPRGYGPLIVGEALDARPRWRVTLRGQSGVAVGDRLLWRGRTMIVRGVMDDPATPDRTLFEAEEER